MRRRIPNLYYQSNALYDYLKRRNITKFEFTSKNLWQLVYGDSRANPKLLVVVSGVKAREIYAEPSAEERKACKRLKQLSSLTKVPMLFIRFTVDRDVENVYIYNNKNKNFTVMTMDKLAQLYKEFGLPVRKGSTSKYLNDKASSAYHKWQRNSLGKDLSVTDIDLMKIDLTKDAIIEIYELKRSYISLSKWEPYEDDYKNFRLLGNLLSGTGIPLKIVYNVRKTKPNLNDDISKLKIFKVDVTKEKLIEYESTIQLEEFIRR